MPRDPVRGGKAVMSRARDHARQYAPCRTVLIHRMSILDKFACRLRGEPLRSKGFSVLIVLLLGGALIPAPPSNADKLHFVPNVFIRDKNRNTMPQTAGMLPIHHIQDRLVGMHAYRYWQKIPSGKFLRTVHTPVSAAKRLQANELSDGMDQPYSPPRDFYDLNSGNSTLDQPARYNEYKYWCARLETLQARMAS
jgi:hypothetical protein